MKIYILDACAVIAVLNQENGAEPVKEILEQAELKKVEIYLNKINLLEVYYDIVKRRGEKIADNILFEIMSSAIKIIDKISDEVLKRAGILKSKYGISLADAIVLAESTIKKAIVITADHHEFDSIEGKENIEFFWIR